MSSSKIKNHIVVTGANGFIGSALCRRLISEGRAVKGAVRSGGKLCALPDKVTLIKSGAIDSGTDWGEALNDIDTVIHLAGLAHEIDKAGRSDISEYRRVNVGGTERLARACAGAGVRRFIFISSVGVNGQASQKKSFTEDDAPSPVGDYAVSKWEAEQALRVVARDTGMEIVIIRPPLVYGPGAPGNFSRLIRLVKNNIPLPLGGIDNIRSFVYIGNLLDAVSCCMEHPMAAGQTFLVSDGQDISTPDLIKMVSSAMGKKAFLFSMHPGILKILCKAIGKAKELEKLTETLTIDDSKIRKTLGWKPPFTVKDGISETVRGI